MKTSLFNSIRFLLGTFLAVFAAQNVFSGDGGQGASKSESALVRDTRALFRMFDPNAGIPDPNRVFTHSLPGTLIVVLTSDGVPLVRYKPEAGGAQYYPERMILMTKSRYRNGQSLSTGDYRIVDPASIGKGGLPLLLMELTQAEKDALRKREQEIANERRIQEEARRKQEAERAKTRAEEERRLAEEKRLAERAAEKARMEAELATERQRIADEERLAEERRADEERKREHEEELARLRAERGKAEQARYAEYAEAKLKALSFDPRDYFAVQASLRDQIGEPAALSDKWTKARAAKDAGDWLALLSVLGGTQRTDYPPPETVDALIEQFKQSEFLFQFKETFDPASSPMIYRIFVSDLWQGILQAETRIVAYHAFFGNFGNDVIRFKISETPYIVMRDDGTVPGQGRAAIELTGRVSSGEMTLQDARKKSVELVQAFGVALDAWLNSH